MIYAQPGKEGSIVSFKSRYENFIGGEWVAPVKGQYFENITPVTGAVICEVPRSSAEDIDLALAHGNGGVLSSQVTAILGSQNTL